MRDPRWLLLAAPALLAGCGTDSGPGAERIVLERELATLSAYQDLDMGAVLGEGDIVVVVHENTLAELLEAALPVEETIADRFHVDLHTAAVDFRTGLALVQFGGRVSLTDRPSTFVEATAFGVLQITGLDPDEGTLLARVEILAIEAQEVRVGGWSAPASRLASELATRKDNEFNQLFGELPVPIHLQRNIRLPAVSNAEVTIPAVTVPLTARVGRVLTADERLWVVIDVEVHDPPDAEPADNVDAEMP